MRINWLITIAIMFFSASIQACSIEKGAEQQYSRFFNLWAERTKADGSEYKVRAMTESERKEAWSCLISSAESGGLSAVQVLELLYRFGSDDFGIEPDEELADYYRGLKLERAPEGTQK